jgi:hypothetical protein
VHSEKREWRALFRLENREKNKHQCFDANDFSNGAKVVGCESLNNAIVWFTKWKKSENFG